MKNSYFIILFFISSLIVFGQDNELAAKIDSINSLIRLSQDGNLDLETRLGYAHRASQLSEDTKIDSIILRSNRTLAFIYLNLREFEQVKTLNHKNLKLATKLQDSLAIAVANINLGFYFSDYELEKRNDSAYYYYYNARKKYNELKDLRREGEVLVNMANIQLIEKDYIGAEVNAIRAISLIQTLPETDRNLDTFWSLYNLLGIIQEKLKNFDLAIEYHEKALTYSDRIPNNNLYNIFTFMNLGEIYQEKRNYGKSLEYFERILKDSSYLKTDPISHSYTLDNISYTRFLSGDNDKAGIETMFKEAYEIAEGMDDSLVMMSASYHLAELYFSLDQKEAALKYTEKALEISRKTNTNEYISKSLLLLSKIVGGDKGKEYLYDHIKLNDSLLNNERNIRNKFARIEFETDQIEAENVRISRERLLFLLLSIGLMLSLTLLYIIINQRAKNRKLEFNQKQQEANEEIYNLMLAQQDKIEEGRTKEKVRISEELHDGILGRLFGTRLSLDSLNMLQTEDAVKSREQYIEELKAIEQEIRKISHDLNTDFIAGSGFVDIVETLIETQTQAYQLTYDFSQDQNINWDKVTNKTKIHFYRMLQETMQNIYKHANAHHIKISFQLKNDVILLSIEDDGSGFIVNKAKKGIGIKNINSRAREIGGQVEIDSKIDEGSTVLISVPYN